MPGTYKRTTKSKSAKGPSRSKKTYSKFAKAAKAKRTQVKRTTKAKPGSRAVKSLALTNAKQIARLKEQQYGEIQKNHTRTNEAQIVSATRPCCLHLNNLMSTGKAAPSWIRPLHNNGGSDQNPHVMEDYGAENVWQRILPHQMDANISADEPNGTQCLWKSTRLDFAFTGWVEHAWIDVMIVKQKVGKDVFDPWRAVEASPKAHYLPYTLPAFREISGPMAQNWVDSKRYTVLQKKRIYLNSLGERAVHTKIHDAADHITEAAAALLALDAQNDPLLVAKAPTTNAVKYCSMYVNPNMLVKQLYGAVTAQGDDVSSMDANPKETHTHGPWSFDNIAPQQNIWCIVSSSDAGDNAVHPDHRTTFTVHKTNVFRDKLDNSRQFTK